MYEAIVNIEYGQFQGRLHAIEGSILLEHYIVHKMIIDEFLNDECTVRNTQYQILTVYLLSIH